MNINEAMEFIHKTVWLGSKPGLSRTTRLLSLLGDPHKKLKFVHVAGTNGKGSTCAMIEAILRDAGYKTGLYTSPYINKFNERMQVCGQMISDEELCRLCDKIKPLSDSMTDDPPTEFELITALAMQYFYDNGCDIVVLEVGLGGELDSTNAIDSPLAAVICAIGLDHTAILGDTEQAVASAKAGVIKKDTDVIIYDCKSSVKKVFEDKCETVGARLYEAGFDSLENEAFEGFSTSFDYGKYKNISLSLLGSYQPKNACVAIKTAEILAKKGYKISEENIRQALKNVAWQGRFELLGTDPIFLLDGAHNPHGMTATVKSLCDRFPNKKITFVVGAMADKDVKGMMEMLLPLADRFFAVTPDNPRAMKAKELSELLSSLGAKATHCDSVFEGVNAALDSAQKDGAVACLGSLYFSGEIRNAYLKITKARQKS